MAIRCLMRALAPLAFLTLSTAAIGASQPSSDMLPVKAYSDLVAAQMCLEHGYPYMVRIGPHDVLCLMSAAGVRKQVVRAQDVIAAAVRAMSNRRGSQRPPMTGLRREQNTPCHARTWVGLISAASPA